MPNGDQRPRHRKQKRITPRQARRALYVDFEGRKVEGEAPVLLGVLYDPAADVGSPDWKVRQFLFDAACTRVDRALGTRCEGTSITAALSWLLDFSDSERRHVVSWSRHDREVIKELTDGRAFRYRNAIATAKRWRARQVGDGLFEDDDRPNELERYEALIGYERSPERFGVGESIAYIRGLSGVTAGALERWNCLLEHNRHDVRAMRDVVWRAVNLKLPPPGEAG